jgi:hypothetical protein
MIRDNPEFIKNMKLEFNATRLSVPIIFLVLAVWIANSRMSSSWNSEYTTTQLKAEYLFDYLCGFGFLFTIVWGSWLVSGSLLEEIKIKSWDFVRMSSLSPFKILIGKIFGATTVVWTVTLLGILPCFVFAAARFIPGDGIIRPSSVTIASLMLCLFFWTLLSYALAMLCSLAEGERMHRNGAFNTTGLVFLAGSLIGPLILSSFEAFHKLWRYGPVSLPSHLKDLPKPMPLPDDAIIVQPNLSYMIKPTMGVWYGFHIYDLDCVLMQLAFFSLWAFIGAWRALRKSLQYRDSPFMWIGFIVASSLFLNGYNFFSPSSFADNKWHEEVYGWHALYWPMLVGLVTMFFASINEAGDIVRYRVLASAFARRAWPESFRIMPLWIISFAAFLVSMILSLLLVNHSPQVVMFFVSLTGFIIRDLLAFHAISWAPNIRRPLVGLLVYIVLVYTLLPAVMGQDYFFPLVSGHPAAGYWLCLAFQITLAGLLFHRQWGKSFRDHRLVSVKLEAA